MSNRFMKVTSGNGEQRWINLDRVTRVSLAAECSGEPVLVFCFDGHEQVKLHGSDEESLGLLRRITGYLDSVADPAGMRRAG